MSERKDEQWLDGQLRRVINTTKPQFDAEAWKQKHAKEYEALVARGRSATVPPPARSRSSRTIWIGPVGKLAVAAAIIVAAGLFFGRRGHETAGPVLMPPPVEQSPAKMVTMMSLSTAFRRGGMEAVEKQFETVIEKLGPRPGGISMAELYRDLES